MKVFPLVVFLSIMAALLGLFIATGSGPAFVWFFVSAFLGLLFMWVTRVPKL